MKVTTEELERCEILLTIEVEPTEEDKLLKKAAKKIARQVQIPGFRPGKAPYHTVVRRFGLETVQQEVLEASAEKIIGDALEEADLRPAAQISFDNVSWEPLTLKIKVPGQPKVELSDYRALRLEGEVIEVTDEDIEQELKKLQAEQAAWAPVERPSQLNDLISISVVEKDGDTVLAEHDSIDYELVFPEPEAEVDEAADSDDEAEAEDETPPFQPDLTTPLLGLSAGDEKTFSIEYPADYSDETYAGKEIAFTVKVGSVKAKELDPLDDEFALSASDFDSLAELKENIAKTLKEQREHHRDHELGDKLLDQIVDGAEKVDWPLALEEEAAENELRRFTAEFERLGLTLESYLQIQKKEEAEFRAEIRENVLKGLKRSIVMAELAKLEKLGINNSEILGRAKAIADSFGGGDQIWQYLLSSEAQQNRLANDLLSEKVLMRLAAIAKGEAPDLEAEAEVETEAALETSEPTAEAAPAEPADEAAEAEAETGAVSETSEPTAEVTEDTDETETAADEPVVEAKA